MGKRLIAILIAFAIGAACLVGVFSHSSDYIDDAIAERPCWGYPNMSWYADFDAVELALQKRIEKGDNPRLLFGSSEFNTNRDGFTNVRKLFNEANYGFDPMCIGQGHIMSLWHAIEVGALDDQIPDNKVVLFLSINWFFSYQNYPESYKAAFAEGAYHALMANPDVSDETKAYVKTKLANYGISESVLDSDGIGFNLDEFFADKASDARRVQQMKRAKKGSGKNPWMEIPKVFSEEEVTVPDWDDIRARAEVEAKEMSTTNEYGYNDEYPKKELDDWIAGMVSKGTQYEGYWNDNEFDDFEIFLTICEECDIEPLIIILPVSGYAYDQTKWTADVRAEYYERNAAICEKHGVQYIDGSPYEYEKHYFKDSTHPGWLLWPIFDEAIYNFFME